MKRFLVLFLLFSFSAIAAERMAIRSFSAGGFAGTVWACQDAKFRTQNACYRYFERFGESNQLVSPATCPKYACECSSGRAKEAVCLGWTEYEDNKECLGDSALEHFYYTHVGYTYNDTLLRALRGLYFRLSKFSKNQVVDRFWVDPCHFRLSGNRVVFTCTGRARYRKCNS